LKEEAERKLAQIQRKIKTLEEQIATSDQKHQQEMQVKEQKIIQLSRDLNDRCLMQSTQLGMASACAKFKLQGNQTIASIDDEMTQLRIS
jgi:cob(I)alamin adenosyltransferase